MLPHLNSSTHSFPRCPLLLRYTCCVRSGIRCIGHSIQLNSISLELSESRILRAASAMVLPRTLLISFCTVQLRTLSAARSLVTLDFSTISGNIPDAGAQWSSAMPPLLGRGWETTTHNFCHQELRSNPLDRVSSHQSVSKQNLKYLFVT